MHWNASRRRTKLPTPLAFCCRATRGSFRGAPYSLTGACSLVCTIRLREWQQRPDRLAVSRSDRRNPYLGKAPLGVVGKEEAFAQLKQCHALERIATPDEIADTACFLLSGNARFFSGSTLFLDGGVLSRLHDPA